MGIGARLALVGDLVDGHSVLEQSPCVPAGGKCMPIAAASEVAIPANVGVSLGNGGQCRYKDLKAIGTEKYTLKHKRDRNGE